MDQLNEKANHMHICGLNQKQFEHETHFMPKEGNYLTGKKCKAADRFCHKNPRISYRSCVFVPVLPLLGCLINYYFIKICIIFDAANEKESVIQ